MGLYFLQKMQVGHSLPTTDATFFPIKFYHTSLLDTDPCQHSLVKNMFEAAKRLSNHKTKKKQALRPNELKQIYGHLSANQSSLENLRLLNICVIAFTGFMRFSEVTSIKIMILFLQKHTWKSLSKKVRPTYAEKGHGFTYHDHTKCAAWNISKTIWDWSILTSAPVNILSELSLNVKSLRRKKKPISYTTIRQNLLKFIKAFGLNGKIMAYTVSEQEAHL